MQMHTAHDVRRAEQQRLSWCQRPLLLKVLVRAFEELDHAHRGPQPLEKLERAFRVKAWLERVSAHA